MLASQGAYLWSSGGKPRLPRAASTPAIDMRGTDGRYADNPGRRKCTRFKIEEGTPERKEMRMRRLLKSKDMRTDGGYATWDRRQMDTHGSRPFQAMKEGMGKNMESNDVCGSSIFLLAE